MTIGAPSTLDPDDCLAQMILHELCHSLIEGAESLGVPDFGLDNESERDVLREHACLRLQAWLTQRYGLRGYLRRRRTFGATMMSCRRTRWRMTATRPRPLAKLGAARSEEGPWAPHLREGLEATAKVFEIASHLGAADPGAQEPPIWSELKQ